jgi:membrane-associated protease RseP (regulator of RpoE activity)
MPASSPSSSDSPKPYREPGAPSSEPPAPVERDAGRDWRRAAVLFFATVVSVFYTAWSSSRAYETAPFGRQALTEGAQFTGALLAILVTHEFGHYIAARIHRVPASPPYFIPMPMLSPFGTMGAIIRMSGRIRTRKALLDIGASGPLAGLVVAIPMYLWGAAHSRFVAIGGEGISLGESLLLKFLDFVAAGKAPPGMELELSPIAFAGWAGLFVTMINLLPVGQLDGGHVAYALFGRKQDRFAAIVHRALLALFFVNLGSFLFRDLRVGAGFVHLGRHIVSSMFWLVWFEVLAVLGTLSQSALPEPSERPKGISNLQRLFALVGLVALAAWGEAKNGETPFWLAWFVGLGLLLAMEVRGGSLRKSTLFDHPPTGPEPLGSGRGVIAIVTLLFFVLLFMPTPILM